MIDITTHLTSPGNDDGTRMQEILEWLDDRVGARLEPYIDVKTKTTVTRGFGWKLGCMRNAIANRTHKTLTFFVEFEDVRDELMFKLIWSASTSQIYAKRK